MEWCNDNLFMTFGNQCWPIESGYRDRQDNRVDGLTCSGRVCWDRASRDFTQLNAPSCPGPAPLRTAPLPGDRSDGATPETLPDPQPEQDRGRRHERDDSDRHDDEDHDRRSDEDESDDDGRSDEDDSDDDGRSDEDRGGDG